MVDTIHTIHIIIDTYTHINMMQVVHGSHLQPKETKRGLPEGGDTRKSKIIEDEGFRVPRIQKREEEFKESGNLGPPQLFYEKLDHV